MSVENQEAIRREQELAKFEEQRQFNRQWEQERKLKSQQQNFIPQAATDNDLEEAFAQVAETSSDTPTITLSLDDFLLQLTSAIQTAEYNAKNAQEQHFFHSGYASGLRDMQEVLRGMING